jgi:hypothetical protein
VVVVMVIAVDHRFSCVLRVGVACASSWKWNAQRNIGG